MSDSDPLMTAALEAMHDAGFNASYYEKWLIGYEDAAQAAVEFHREQLAGMVDPDTYEAMLDAAEPGTRLVAADEAARVADVRTAAAVAPYLAVVEKARAFSEYARVKPIFYHDLRDVRRALTALDSLEGKAP